MPKTPPVDPSQLPYRLGAGAMLVNRAGMVFVAQRIDNPGPAWQMPQGGLDKGENAREAVLRELEEETGTNKAEIVAESPDWVTYDLPLELIPKVWKGRYRGQKQKWFVLKFLGQDDDIDINTDHPEFSDWKWTELERLPELIVPFKRDLYTELVGLFRPVVEKIAADG